MTSKRMSKSMHFWTIKNGLSVYLTGGTLRRRLWDPSYFIINYREFRDFKLLIWTDSESNGNEWQSCLNVAHFGKLSKITKKIDPSQIIDNLRTAFQEIVIRGTMSERNVCKTLPKACFFEQCVNIFCTHLLSDFLPFLETDFVNCKMCIKTRLFWISASS